MRSVNFFRQSRVVLLASWIVVVFAWSSPSSHAQKAPRSGTHERTLLVEKKKRAYLLHIPRGYARTAKSGKRVPLVVMLHGRGGNGEVAASRYYGWKQLADKKGFVAVFPTALGSPTSWDGAWRGRPTPDTVFLSKLIDELKKELRIDADRVFMTGHSSGGFMSYSFAAMHADKVAAIGPVAGLRIATTVPKTPVAVIAIHGMADKVVAYDDVHGKKAAYNGMPSAIDSAAFFAKHNGCGPKKRSEMSKGTVLVDTWRAGKGEGEGRSSSEVVLYSLVKGGHGWPKGGSRSVAATKIIWEFFEAQGRRPSETNSKEVKPKKVDSKSGSKNS